MGLDRTRVFLIRLHVFFLTALGEDENPVKPQQSCTCSYELCFKEGLGGFPTQRKQHDWTVKHTGFSLLYAGLHCVVLPYATVGLIKHLLNLCQLLCFD